ncbi:hypothetical protein [Marinobacterium stanieri]|uniref:Uncharacterized protein n=1 Tax=Marinobacterium stanieri TaxID=49186 RepID=A0A1N6XA64_9GAMM|nr:hypothetical protein [Marinobacterium stanieri]SIQ99149.1 hypothetical protein SAMN05421647_11340 [Marinobacterium stanieri]
MSEEQPTKRKGKVAIGIVKEVSTFTFIERAVRANIRAVSQGKNYLVDSYTQLVDQTKSDIEHGQKGDHITAAELPLIERQVYLLNACLSMLIYFVGTLTTIGSMITLALSPSGQRLVDTFKASPVLWYGSTAISVFATVCISLMITVTFKHFQSLRSCTLTPAPLIAEYRNSFDFLINAALIYLATLLLFQTTNSDIARTVFGVVLISTGIGTWRSFRCIYSPTISARTGSGRYPKLLLGLKVFRLPAIKASEHDTASRIPYLPLLIIWGLYLATLATKNMSLISLFSSFAVVIIIGVLTSVFIAIWILEHDGPATR